MSPYRYGLKEVGRLVKAYAALRVQRDTTEHGIVALVACADLESAARTLVPEHRAVLLLHGVLGLSGTDVARLLGITERAVYYRYHDALRAMQWHLNGGR